ncbi:phage tail tube protein [Leclercia sp.]|uniref:phage tail tube protein n=1 Tax=Leclercia sp. TaxID=1898428 RepID=UPI002898BC2D|nr:hypothetical protein [Leclercia sp.]
MANCPSSNERLFGGAVVLEVADGCPDVKPLEAEWMSLAAGTSKGFDFNPNSVTSDADDGGGYVETIITNSDFTISFEGEVRKKDKLDQYGIGKFIKYFADELKAKRQPGIWVRMDYGPVEFVGYMTVTALSSDGGTNDIVTFSTEFKVGDASTIEVNETNAPVTVPLAFTKNLPATKTADEDNDVVWDVEVTGGRLPYTYKWYFASTLIDPAINPTAATATLVNRAVTSASAGSYHCVVTDKTGATITSATSVLTVN